MNLKEAIAALIARLEAIQQIADDYRTSVGHAEHREREERQRHEETIAEQVRLVNAAERKRSAEHKQNLCPQWIIGLGTWAAVIAACIYAGIASCTLIQIRHQTMLLDKQLTTTQDTAKRQLRAYVEYDHGEVHMLPDGTHYQVLIWVKNSGQTIAWSLTKSWTSKVGRRIITNPLGSPDMPFEETSDFPSTDLGAGSSLKLRDDNAMSSISPQELRSLESGNTIRVWGLLNYRDVYERCEAVFFYAQTGSEIPKDGWELDSLKAYSIDFEGQNCNKKGKYHRTEIPPPDATN